MMIHTLSTVGSTRALFFRGPWGISPLLVPSPGPGAKRKGQLKQYTEIKGEYVY